MDVVMVILGVVSILLLATLLVLAVVFRPRAGVALELAPVRQDVASATAALRQDLSAQRSELQTSLAQNQQRQDAQLTAASDTQTQRLERARVAQQQAEVQLREALHQAMGEMSTKLDTQTKTQSAWQQEFRLAVDAQLSTLRQENDTKLEKIRETVDEKLRESLAKSLQENADRIQQLNRSTAEKHIELQDLLRAELDKLRTGNEAKLEKMRETVDEKLQGTLEKRLGESFALVSERLEQVQKGLGEMQTLASDVGGLKRVLTNVKNRGSWGEVQLSRQLEDILTHNQYEENVAIRPGDSERVEFAVRLPGRDEDGTPVYLPIDSKFPQEDYERLLQAQEAGDKDLIDAVSRDLEKVVLAQAKLISQKYIQPPYSTDFAIMYLPTEGLFAEVVRRPGLAAKLQREQRILVTGPTTLMSLLNSLQVGFRSIAIEKRSSEVWQVLSAAKTEFQKYGQVWEKLGKQLQTAQNTVTEAGRRTRAVERRLRVVEASEIETADASVPGRTGAEGVALRGVVEILDAGAADDIDEADGEATAEAGA